MCVYRLDVASAGVDAAAAASGGRDATPFLGSRTAGFEIVWPNARAYSDYVDVAVSEALRLEGAIDTRTPLLLSASYSLTLVNSSTVVWLAKAQGMIGKVRFLSFFFAFVTQLFSFIMNLRWLEI